MENMIEQDISWKSGPSNAPLPPWTQVLNLPEKAEYTLGQVSSFFLESYKVMGPIYRFRRFNQEFTVISGIEANQFMARKAKHHFCAHEFRREQNEELGVEKTLVSMNGAEHQWLRRLQKGGYSRSVLDHQYPELVALTQGIVRTWQPSERILLKEVMPRIVAEQLGIGVLNHPLGDNLEDILIFVRTVVIETVARMRPKCVIHMPFYRRAKANAIALADQVIEYHRATTGQRQVPDLVDDLLAAFGKYEGLRSQQELRIAVLGGYIGGLDTVANTCCFMIYALLKHPDVLVKVVAEVDDACRGGVPSPPMVRNMTTLHYAALETLRMYPVAAAVQGTVSFPFEFAGYRVEEGTNLIIATTVPHHLWEYFPDPHQFDIDRYSKPRSEHRRPGAFAPYGVGKHTCLGAGMAEVFIKLTIASILRTVRLEIDPPDYELEIEAMPTPVPSNFYVRVVEQRA